ncbi:MAG TPA: tetratricopeptide repeat protein, partial [Coleofasciculaceae cyanobacterium]
MRLQKIGLTALLTLVATLTLNNFPVISNPKSPAQKSYVLAQTPADRKAEADRLLQQGFDQLDANQMEAALQSFQQALLIYRDIKDRRSEAGALGGLGNVYGFLGNFAKTIEYHEQALAIAKELQDRQIERAALGTLGAAYNALGNYRKAIEYHEQALALARTMK